MKILAWTWLKILIGLTGIKLPPLQDARPPARPLHAERGEPRLRPLLPRDGADGDVHALVGLARLQLRLNFWHQRNAVEGYLSCKKPSTY